MMPTTLSITRRELLRFAPPGAAGATNFADSADSTLREISPTDSDPFNYPYYLSVPPTETERERPLLVQPNNTGTATDDFDTHRRAARRDAESGFPRLLSDELGVPLLVPVFPRPESAPVDWRHYVHQLDTETMHISDGPLERVDRQLIGMIEDARDRLDDELPIGEQVMLNGYSASGNFVNRFTILHPELVTSVTAGGVNGMVTLPRSEADGQTLNYQLGVADLEDLTGSPFDLAAFRAVDQYIYMGAADENDTLQADDAWNEQQRALARAVYGEDMQADRFPFCESVYQGAGASAEFRLYDGVGHTVTEAIERDVIEFHRQHGGIPEEVTDAARSDGDFRGSELSEALGVPLEAAVTALLLIVGSVAYLLRRLEE